MRNRKQAFNFNDVQRLRGINIARDGSSTCAYYLVASCYYYFVNRDASIGAVQERLGRRDAHALEMAKGALMCCRLVRSAVKFSNRAENQRGYSEL